MDTCDGKVITRDDIKKAWSDISWSFTQAKSDNLLPADAQIFYMPRNPHGVMITPANGNLYVDLAYLSCLDSTQIESIMMHEVYHYKWPSAVERVNIDVQIGLAVVCAAACIVRMGYNYLHSRIPSNVYRYFRFAGQETTRFIAAALVAHTMHGTMIAYAGKVTEISADNFSARMMSSGEPLRTALKKHTSISIDRSMPEKLYYYMLDLKVYGVIGMRYTHPDGEERIANLRAYKAPRPAQITP